MMTPKQKNFYKPQKSSISVAAPSNKLHRHSISENLHRRHLTSSQRSVIALDVEQAFALEAAKNAGGRPKKEDIVTLPIFEASSEKPPEIFPEVSAHRESRQKAAAVTGTNPRYVSDAKKIQSESPETLEQVRTGRINIPAEGKTCNSSNRSSR